MLPVPAGTDHSDALSYRPYQRYASQTDLVGSPAQAMAGVLMCHASTAWLR